MRGSRVNCRARTGDSQGNAGRGRPRLPPTLIRPIRPIRPIRVRPSERDRRRSPMRRAGRSGQSGATRAPCVEISLGTASRDRPRMTRTRRIRRMTAICWRWPSLVPRPSLGAPLAPPASDVASPRDFAASEGLHLRDGVRDRARARRLRARAPRTAGALRRRGLDGVYRLRRGRGRSRRFRHIPRPAPLPRLHRQVRRARLRLRPGRTLRRARPAAPAAPTATGSLSAEPVPTRAIARLDS